MINFLGNCPFLTIFRRLLTTKFHKKDCVLFSSFKRIIMLSRIQKFLSYGWYKQTNKQKSMLKLEAIHRAIVLSSVRYWHMRNSLCKPHGSNNLVNFFITMNEFKWKTGSVDKQRLHSISLYDYWKGLKKICYTYLLNNI